MENQEIDCLRKFLIYYQTIKEVKFLLFFYLKLMLFLFFIIILYIFNSHYSVKTQFSIKKLDEEIKELNSEYIILKSEIMNLSKQSEVAKMVEADSLKIITTPPTPLAPFQSEQP